jgi:hypothetical protein
MKGDQTILQPPKNLDVKGKAAKAATEGSKTFAFDKSYWNTRLHTEHERLCNMFSEGEAICDVMAGVGPFAVPAGKKKCFVWANDLNPESYNSLVDNIKINKVGDFVQSRNTDGAAFIRQSAADLLSSEHSVPIYPKVKSSRSAPAGQKPEPDRILTQPRSFSHFLWKSKASAKHPLLGCHISDVKDIYVRRVWRNFVLQLPGYLGADLLCLGDVVVTLGAEAVDVDHGEFLRCVRREELLDVIHGHAWDVGVEPDEGGEEGDGARWEVHDVV